MKMWKTLKRSLLALAALCMFFGMTAAVYAQEGQAASKEDLVRDIKGRYVIRDVNDLNTFRASLETETYEGETVVLAADINCAEGLVSPGYTVKLPTKDKGRFMGEFDGAGHRISGYNDAVYGLVPQLDGYGEIHDLAIEADVDLTNAPNLNSSNTKYLYYGVFCNYVYMQSNLRGVNISRCAVSGKIFCPTKNNWMFYYIAGFIGCADLRSSYYSASDKFLFKDCSSSIDLDLNIDVPNNTYCYASGFMGSAIDNGYGEKYECMVNCVYTGTIKNSGNVQDFSGNAHEYVPFYGWREQSNNLQWNGVQETLYYDRNKFTPELFYSNTTIDPQTKDLWVALIGDAVTLPGSYQFTDKSAWNFPEGGGYPQVVMQKGTPATIPVTGITLPEGSQNLKLQVGEQKKIEAAVSPQGASADDLTYTSSSDLVATVDASGAIRAKGVGTAEITVTPKEYEGIYDGYQAPSVTCEVEVEAVPVTKISISPEKLELKEGAKQNLKVTFTPDNATDKTLEYSSDKPEVASVDASGKVTAVKAGTATITVTAKGGKDVSASCQVTVIKEEPSTEPPSAEGTGTAEPGKPGTDQPSSSDTPSTVDQGQTEPSTEPSTEKLQPVKIGAKATVGQSVYKVTTKNTVAYQASKSKKAKVTVPDKVSINGRSYKVTSIAANAFKNNKKLTQVTIGKNIKSIGANAFYGCRKLKKVTIKTTKLKDGNVGNNAFKGIYAKATVKVPSAKLKAYKALLQKKGAGKKAVFKK